MVSSKAASRLASLSVLFSTARAQINPDFTRSNPSTTRSSSSTPASSSSTSNTPSSTSISSSSTMAGRGSYTTAVVPLYLYKAVESFLDDFPSTRPNYFTAQSWPSTLVIGTATYGLQAKAVTKASTQSSRSATATDGSQRTSDDPSHNQNKDKRLSIILGVVIGFVALGLMGVLFWFLARRKKKAGSFFMRRSSPSTSSSHSRRLAGLGTVSQAVSRPAKERTMSTSQHGESALLRPPHLHHQSSRSTTDDMPFHTPLEEPADKKNQQALDDQRAELARIIRGKSAYPQSSSTAKEIGRPPPFSPESLHQAQPPTPPNRNRESDHIVSPISPSKSFERESTSIVHYPSMDEVNDFDFAGDGRKGGVGGQKGWHPARQRIDGRHEMA